MDKRLQNLNQSQIMSGVALFSTAALSVYSVKNIIDINKKIDDIQEDMEKIKLFITENQRKSNITAANLGKKLEDVQMKFINLDQRSKIQYSQPLVRQPSPQIVEVDDVEDEVINFLQN